MSTTFRDGMRFGKSYFREWKNLRTHVGITNQSLVLKRSNES
jgi:hypothetical protein